MELTYKEKAIVRYMYMNIMGVADLIYYSLDGHELTRDDVYELFEKVGLTNVIKDL